MHDARRAGIAPGRLRSSDLDRRVFGMRAPAGALDDLHHRCLTFAARLPNEMFISHSTAALLLGVPLPYRLENAREIHVTVAAPQRAPHADGIVGHSRRVEQDDVRVFNGVRISSPERVWCELASQLSTDDLVAAGDHLIHRGSAWSTPDRLNRRCEVGDRISRSPRLRAALPLLDPRAESRRETLLRLLLHRHGLSSPAINRVVVRTTAGRDIRCDFIFGHERVAVEYQGDYHRSAKQWREDMTRRGRLESAGWYVMEVNADDLTDPADLISRIRTALARQLKLLALERSSATS